MFNFIEPTVQMALRATELVFALLARLAGVFGVAVKLILVCLPIVYFGSTAMWLIQAAWSGLTMLPEYTLEAWFFLRHTVPAQAWDVLASITPDLASVIARIRTAWLCEPPRTLFLFWTFPQSRYCELYNTWHAVPTLLSDFDRILMGTCALTLLGVLIYSKWSVKPMAERYLFSLIMTEAGEEHVNVPEMLRSKFNELALGGVNVRGTHTHGESAADRSRVSEAIDKFCASSGYDAYYVQMSRSDERKARLGSRAMFWAKDFNVTAKDFNPPQHSVLAYVDVDQYMDMPSMLANNFQPHLIYTFQPDSVAKVEKEYSYTFDEHDVVDYRVTGGGQYVHPVWNYSPDNILAIHYSFGIPVRSAIYGIDRKHSAPDHEVILLTPLRRWGAIGTILAVLFLGHNRLERLRVSFNGFLRLAVQSTTKGHYISTGKPGNYAHANITVEQDNALATIAKTSKFDLTMPQVTTFTEGDRVAGSVLLEFHRSGVAAKPSVVCPVEDSVRSYQFKPQHYEPAKPLMRPYMAPLLAECYTPENTKTSEKKAVRERVEKVRSQILFMTPFMLQCMKEFAAFLIPVAHQLDPVEDDEVFERQNRPTQRRILEESQYERLVRKVKSFLKKEPYADVKAPRVISTINGQDKWRYSKYIYALTDGVLKHQDWYAFGKTPLQIAERVAIVCMNALNDASNSDFKKFDGHGSNLMRELEHIVLCRAFRPVHHAEVIELHKAQYGMTAHTTLGVKYETEYSRCSGSPETASFNGITNAFVTYFARRLRTETGFFMEPDAAWHTLGIYGGDDGLTADMDKTTYLKSATMLGQVLEVDPIPRGQFGVTFLARIYPPTVWNGEMNSCCDLPRQLSKLHVTVALPGNVTPEDKLIEKMRAYWLTDKNTPIIGEMARKCLDLIGGQFVENQQTKVLRSWAANFTPDQQYPNEPGIWMYEYLERCLPDIRIEEFRDWLDSVVSVTQMLTPPLLREPPEPAPDFNVVVTGYPNGPTVYKRSRSEEVVPRDRKSVTPSPERPLTRRRGGKGKEKEKLQKTIRKKTVPRSASSTRSKPYRDVDSGPVSHSR